MATCENIRFLDNSFLNQALSVTSDEDYNGQYAIDATDVFDFGRYRLTENAELGGYVIDIELNGELQPSTFAMVPHDTTKFYLTSETEVVVQASNSGFDTIEKTFTGRWSRFGVFCDFMETGVDNSYRFWRIWIKEFNRGESEKNESIDIKYFYLGDHVEIDDRNIATGIGIEMIDRSKIQIVESGRAYSNKKRKQLKLTNLRFQHMTSADRSKFQIFYEEKGKTDNFLCIPDPSNASESVPFDLMRVFRLEKLPRGEHKILDQVTMNFSLIEAL